MSRQKIAKNIFSLTLAEFATKGIAFFLNAYIARIFDVEGFGIVSKVTSIFLYILIIVNLGFAMTGLRTISKDFAQYKKYVNNIITFKLVIAVVCFLLLCAYIFLTTGLSPTVQIALLLGSLQLFAAVLQIDWFFQAIERMEILGLRQVLVNLTTFVCVLIFVHSPSDIPLYIFIVSVSLFLNNIWLLILYIRQYSKINLTISLSFWKELLRVGLPIAASNLFIIVLNSFNILLISATYGEFETGLFTAAIKLYSFCLIPSVIIQNAFIPSIARAVLPEDKRREEKLYSTIVSIVGSIIPLVIIFFPNFFIDIIFSNNFREAIPATRLIMAACLIAFYNVSITPTLFSWGAEKKVMLTFGISAAVSIILNIILVTKFSIIGAAITNIICEATAGTFLSVFLFKEIRKIFVSIFLKVIGIALISVSMSYKLSIGHTFLNITKYLKLNTLVSDGIGIAISFIFFTILILLFNIVKFSDIKKLVKR